MSYSVKLFNYSKFYTFFDNIVISNQNHNSIASPGISDNDILILMQQVLGMIIFYYHSEGRIINDSITLLNTMDVCKSRERFILSGPNFMTTNSKIETWEFQSNCCSQVKKKENEVNN